MVPSWVWLIVLAAALAGLYVWYAVIIVRRNKVREALSSVDVHLNQRHDLIPNIVKLAARLMEHERGLIEEVTRLRGMVHRPHSGAPGEVEARFALEAQLAQQVGRLLVTMEAYPEVKSDTAVVEAQRTWTEVEAQITAARRFYNAAVNQLNTAIQVFPGSLLAGFVGVRPMPYFEAPAAVHAAPSVDGLLGPSPSVPRVAPAELAPPPSVPPQIERRP
jgi:LemA protein